MLETGALKRAVSRVSVKETGVRPSMLACNLVLFVFHSSVIIHITKPQSSDGKGCSTNFFSKFNPIFALILQTCEILI